MPRITATGSWRREKKSRAAIALLSCPVLAQQKVPWEQPAAAAVHLWQLVLQQLGLGPQPPAAVDDAAGLGRKAVSSL